MAKGEKYRLWMLRVVVRVSTEFARFTSKNMFPIESDGQLMGAVCENFEGGLQ